jgi:chemotaxis protein methyltransferase CheR
MAMGTAGQIVSPARGATPAASNPYLVRIRDLIYSEAGIFYSDSKLHTLEERCVSRMKEAGAISLRSYYEVLATSRHSELVNLLNKITVGETCFFRNQPQLDALRKIVLPKIAEAKSKSAVRQIRVWSAGCSTGEEPYTLAMMFMEESLGVLKDFRFEIQATDLNELSLEHAHKGLYSDYSTRNLTPYFRQKYFLSSNDGLQVNPLLQSKVQFSRLNLQDASRMVFMKGMDIIFCCNVLIYFDTNSKRMVIQHFYNSLSTHGYLFLGHSESLYGISDDFHLVHMPSATGYMKSPRACLVQG